MTRTTRRRIVRSLAVLAGAAAVGLAVPQADAAPVAPAAEGLCIDLSALNLPSLCLGSLLG